MTKQTDALGQSMTVDSYNLMGLPESYQDKNGNWFTCDYNAYGSLTKKISLENPSENEIMTNIYSVNNLLIQSNTETNRSEAAKISDMIKYNYDKYGYLSKK